MTIYERQFVGHWPSKKVEKGAVLSFAGKRFEWKHRVGKNGEIEEEVHGICVIPVSKVKVLVSEMGPVMGEDCISKAIEVIGDDINTNSITRDLIVYFDD